MAQPPLSAITTIPGEDDAIPDCESCGACCAYSWEWPTLVGFRDGDGIPPYFLEDGRMRCDGNRCSALAGTLGEEVFCKVYENRPLVCREFAAGSESCHAVRRHFGLEPDTGTAED